MSVTCVDTDYDALTITVEGWQQAVSQMDGA